MRSEPYISFWIKKLLNYYLTRSLAEKAMSKTRKSTNQFPPRGSCFCLILFGLKGHWARLEMDHIGIGPCQKRKAQIFIGSDTVL